MFLSVLSKRESPSGANLDYSKSLERIAGMLREAGRDAGTEIMGSGIGSTAPVDPFSGEFGDLDFLPRWRGKSRIPSGFIFPKV